MQSFIYHNYFVAILPESEENIQSKKFNLITYILHFYRKRDTDHAQQRSSHHKLHADDKYQNHHIYISDCSYLYLNIRPIHCNKTTIRFQIYKIIFYMIKIIEILDGFREREEH